MRAFLASALFLLLALIAAPSAQAREAADRADSFYTAAGYVAGSARFDKAQRVQTRAERRAWQRTGRYIVRSPGRRTIRGAVVAEKKFEPLASRTFLGYAHELANAKGSVSVTGLPGPLIAVINQVQRACPGFKVISAFRKNARIAGTGHRSLHADHKAADIAGPDYHCAYRVLAGFPGGVSTDAWRMRHIHVSYDPNGREWNKRFAHYAGKKYSRYASRWKKRRWRQYGG